MKFKGIIKGISNALSKNERKILTIITIGAEALAIYEAIKEGPTFKKILDEKKEAGAGKLETIKAVAPSAIKIAAPFAVSASAALLNHKKASDTISSLSSLYTLSKTVHEEYKAANKEAIKEEFGEEAAERIERKTAGKQASKVYYDTVNDPSQIIVTGHGNDLFYDAWSGRFFYSDINYVKSIVNSFNYRLRSEMWLTANELYSDLGVGPVGAGKTQGWSAEYGEVEVTFYAEMDDLDKPYTVMEFKNEPVFEHSLRRW